MSQRLFTANSTSAGAASGTAPVTSTTAANYTIYNKTLGTIEGTITGSGAANYTVDTPTNHPHLQFHGADKIEVSGNGTNDMEISFKLDSGESAHFVLTSSAAGTLLLGDVEMLHTSSGARDSYFRQVILSTVA